jgi:hypothetical protein
MITRQQQITHSLLSSYECLIAIEEYMVENHIHPRPKSVADLKIPGLIEKYTLKKHDIERVLAVMKTNSSTKSAIDEWPLNTDTLIPWRGLEKKNGPRDRQKHAHVSLVERALVKEYRKDMFIQLRAAYFIQYNLHSILTRASIPWTILARMASGSMSQITTNYYPLPDKIRLNSAINYPIQNVDAIIQNRKRLAATKVDFKDINDIIKLVQKKNISRALPGGKFISREISGLLNSLVEVSVMSVDQL